MTLDRGTMRLYVRYRVVATSSLYVMSGYEVDGNTFRMTRVTSVDHYLTFSRGDLNATFSFDGTRLVLTPVPPWPCDAQVLWASHPWTLTKRAS